MLKTQGSTKLSNLVVVGLASIGKRYVRICSEIIIKCYIEVIHLFPASFYFSSNNNNVLKWYKISDDLPSIISEQ